MNTDTALTVPTLPLVFLNDFSGNLDDWDPLVTDGLAAENDVIVFDNAGVGRSGGETPSTVSEMMRNALAFCDARWRPNARQI
jgi:pimeloyl-ACP methyl ester carboxylesterase